MLKLAAESDADWGVHAVSRIDEILVDHAHLEKKAAGMAVTLLFQYPDRPALQAPLAALAREELAHFEEVLVQLERRGVGLRPTHPSPYAGRLRRAIRTQEPERLVDTLLCCALIEARSCERLGMLADALPAVDTELARFYRGLRNAEARHHGIYVDLAGRHAEPDEVAARLDVLAAHEARVIAEAPVAPRLHDRASAPA